MSPARTAVVFDLDGTLVDTEPLYFEAIRELLAERGVTGFGWEEHTGFIGIGTLETMETLRDRFVLDTSPDELLARVNELYGRLLRTRTRVFPEMRRFVELLHAEGVPMAVASGSSLSAIGTALRVAGIDGYFPVTVSSEEVGAGKPEPDVFLEAVRRLGFEPGECAAVEDSEPGVAAAHAAGMRCVAVPSVPGAAGGPGFGTAGLVYPGGQAEFSAQGAYDWLLDGAARR
jgi:HAD superfamily hydrolase (TIGR01509 family)